MTMPRKLMTLPPPDRGLLAEESSMTSRLFRSQRTSSACREAAWRVTRPARPLSVRPRVGATTVTRSAPSPTVY